MVVVVFPKALLDASISCHRYAKIWFQKQFLVVILYKNVNVILYLTSERSQSKKKC